MNEITVISGKGGTGKTSLVGCFASLSATSVLTDCDVDAANLSLIMRPLLKETHDFRASRKAFIYQDKCTRCNLCRELCRFEAISVDYEVDSLSCEGCGVCYYACPEEAITYEELVSGQWFVSETPYGPLVHARLGIAEENSGKLVTLVRNRAREIGEAENRECIITDGPPGIGCPVIASLAGSHAALVVTEPTLSGIHDLERVAAVCRHFGVPALVCVNRFDLDEENTSKIEEYCRSNEVPFAGKIPHDKRVTEAMLEGLPVVDYTDAPISDTIREVWARLTEYLNGGGRSKKRRDGGDSLY